MKRKKDSWGIHRHSSSSGCKKRYTTTGVCLAKTLEKSLISVFENQTENLLVASRFGIFVRHYGSGIFNETLREHFPLETTKAVFFCSILVFSPSWKKCRRREKVLGWIFLISCYAFFLSPSSNMKSRLCKSRTALPHCLRNFYAFALSRRRNTGKFSRIKDCWMFIGTRKIFFHRV